MADKHSVKVSIAGEEYSLRTDRSTEYTQSVAEHVDKTLQGILKSGAVLETHKAAVLTALAITDELFQSRMTSRDVEQRLLDLTNELSRFLPPKKRPSRISGPFATLGDDG